MTHDRSRKSIQRPPQSPLEKLTICLFFVGILLSVTHKLWAYDVWWHLKTGEWIWTHHAVPQMDLYSYTVPDHPWIDLSWLFQLLTFMSYRLMGINGIILFKVSIVTFTFYLLFRFFYRKSDLFLLLLILSLTLFASHERLVERPEVLSYLFLVSYLLILEKDRQKPTRLLYVLPFFQILWVNTHALFILGLLAICAICLGEVLSWFFSRKKERNPFPTRLILILAVLCVATLVNPYGLKGAFFPATLLTRISGEIEIFTLGIGEFTRPLAGYDPSFTILFYKTLFMMTLLSFLLNRKRFSYSYGILFLLFAYLSLIARRNIAPFSLVSCFLLLINLEGFLQGKPHFFESLKSSPFLKKMKPAKEGILLSLTLLLPLPFITNVFYEHEGFNKRFGLGISKHRYAIRAADFIEKSDLSGNLFNSGLEVGNYFIWRFYPKRKVFMDGRLEVYHAPFFEETFRLFNTPSLWPKWEKKYQINFCILDHTIRKQDNLIRELYQRKDWAPIYYDELVIIFLRDVPKNKDILKKYAIDLEKTIPPPKKERPPKSLRGLFVPKLDFLTTDLRIADLYAKLGLLEKAEWIYRECLDALPQNAAIHHNLGNIFRQQGKRQEALLEYRQAVTLRPKYFIFRYSLGEMYLEMGEEDLALKEFRKSLGLSSYFGEAHYRLGKLYEKKGWLTKAEKEYRRVNASDPAYLSARNALGILYAEKGEFEKAENEFKKILKVNPDAGEARGNLRRLDRLKRERLKHE